MIRAMKRGSQASRISKAQPLRFCRRSQKRSRCAFAKLRVFSSSRDTDFQKRSRCAFGNPCPETKTGRGGFGRPRRVPAAVTRSAQTSAACLSLAVVGRAPFSKSAAVALLNSTEKASLRAVADPGAYSKSAAAALLVFAPSGRHHRSRAEDSVFQKRSHCAFAETPKAQPLRFCRNSKSAAIALLPKLQKRSRCAFGLERR